MEYLSRNWHKTCVWGRVFLPDLRWSAIKGSWFWALKWRCFSRPESPFLSLPFSLCHTCVQPFPILPRCKNHQVVCRAGTELVRREKGQVYFSSGTDMLQEHQSFLKAARCFGMLFLAGVALGLRFCKGTVHCYHRDCLTVPVKSTCVAEPRFFFFMHVLGFDKRGMCSWETLWTTAVIFVWQYSKGNYISNSSIIITTYFQFSLLLITMNWKMPGRVRFCFFLGHPAAR